LPRSTGGTVKGPEDDALWQTPPEKALLLEQRREMRTTVGDLPDAQWKAFHLARIARRRAWPDLRRHARARQRRWTPKERHRRVGDRLYRCPAPAFARDLIDVNGAMKTLKSFTLLKATVGSTA